MNTPVDRPVTVAWTVSTAYAILVSDVDRLEAMGEALADYDAVVGGDQGVVEVILTLQAASLIEAGQRTVALLAEVGLPADALRQLEVIDEAEAERRFRAPSLPDLAGGREVADLLGVTRQRLHQLLAREDFPDPIFRLAATPVWLVASIRAFERGWSRKPGRPPVSAPTAAAS